MPVGNDDPRLWLTIVVFGLVFSLPIARSEPADRVVETEPNTAPLSPAESMKHFRLAEGFRIELVASEPMIRQPVALTWDGNGRLYVAEMRSYMQDLEGIGSRQPVGRVCRLEDSDGDGRLDKRTVFLDGLVEPRTLLAVDDALLIGEPPVLWLCRDTDGDGRADSKEAVTDKFSLRDSNVEHKANSLTRGIDNWIHVSQHSRRYQVHGDSTVTQA
ncbi:MAG: dehydrogenase, partial [Verrucomicrobiota bacterium]